MPKRLVYLDHNATTPLDDRVAQAMLQVWQAGPANPSSQHTFGRQARRRLEAARESIAQMLGADTTGRQPDRVIFTSGGTEANNLALFGLLFGFLGLSSGDRSGSAAERANKPASSEPLGPPEIIISAIEHPSILSAAGRLRQRGVVVHLVPPDRQGVVRPQAVAGLLNPRTRLVSVMLANNETGVLQPVAEIAGICKSFPAPAPIVVHTDAVQAVGKHRVHFRELGVDAMTVAPHKFGGPLGIGALVVKAEALPQPLLFGGFQQGGLRPGTESVALAVGFAEALRLAVEELPQRTERMRQLRDRLEEGLAAAVADCLILGREVPRLPNTTCVAFPGVDRQALVMALDLDGVACSTGSACASGSSEPSPVLLAMGLDRTLVEGAIRLSLGHRTTPDELDWALERIFFHVNKLRR
jgi:cysteine desulfurase